MLRVVNEFKAFLISTPLLFVKKAASSGEMICILFHILQPNDKFVIVFIEIHLICILLYLFQLLFTADLIDKVLIVAIVCLLILLVLYLLFIVRLCLRVFLIRCRLFSAHNFIQRDRCLLLIRCR